jgi:hypothetical protein
VPAFLSRPRRVPASSIVGQFFITLGADIYETLDPDRRLVVAIAVPTRAYAAVLLALGVIANGSGAGNDAAHVDQISELVIDTPVFLFKEQTDGMHRAKGLYKGWSLKNAGGKSSLHQGPARPSRPCKSGVPSYDVAFHPGGSVPG